MKKYSLLKTHTANQGEGPAAGEAPEGGRFRSGARGLASGRKNLHDLSDFWLHDFSDFSQKYAPMPGKNTCARKI